MDLALADVKPPLDPITDRQTRVANPLHLKIQVLSTPHRYCKGLGLMVCYCKIMNILMTRLHNEIIIQTI